MKKQYKKPEINTFLVELAPLMDLSKMQGTATGGEVLSREGGRGGWVDDDED